MIPHLRVPFRIDGGRALLVEHGTDEELAQNVRVILGTRPGERLVVGDFGVPDPLFEVLEAGAPERGILEATVARWESRAVLEIERTTESADGQADYTVRVSRREG